ncbi:hypothetical protein JFQ88_001427 [Aeromonas dhakensis]|uniref:hypothetical protein n=1 Tax=Aeromonas dhakensis TaxID=196024 RepID=UPI000F891D4D|nr:hypothetical protein [Aeromonas dhakensis]EIM1707609.1 hypothetical protein [Aeromonas dhakensis]RUQ10971.1 hypothetical protein CX648_20360 [Aeromonas dhakensis]
MRKTGVALAISSLFWFHSAMAAPLIFPDDPALSNGQHSPTLERSFQLAQDDLGNRIHQLHLPLQTEPELVAELEQIGREQGFSVSTHADMYAWTEDNMWLSRDGALVFRPQAPLADKGRYHAFVTALTEQSPEAEQEGHHSLGSQDSQGLDDYMLSQANSFAEAQGRELIPTFSIIDGGNMLTGQRPDGTPYALIGRDALLQTTLHHSRLDSERIATRQQKMESDGEFRLQLSEEEWLGSPHTFQKGHDTEVDLILLEAANLLPQGLDEPQRHAFARTARAKAELAQSEVNWATRQAAEQRMFLSSQQGERIAERYRAIHGQQLPASFDLLAQLKREYAGLVVTAGLHADFGDEQITDVLQTLTADAATLTRLGRMLQAGGYQRTGLAGAEQDHQTRRFLAMMAISQRLMAQELKVAERDLVILAQPGFHLDMAMRPLADGRILFNDHAASAALIEQVLASDAPLSESERQELAKSVTDLRQQGERWHKIHVLIHQQLRDAGLTPIATPGAFSVGRRPVNWMNGIMGTRQQPFYITNAASIAPLNQAFAAWLQHEVAGLTPYFVGQAASNRRDGLNQAEALLRGSGGLDCITLHHE